MPKKKVRQPGAKKKFKLKDLEKKILSSVIKTVKQRIRSELKAAIGTKLSKLPKDFWSRLQVRSGKDYIKLSYSSPEFRNQTYEARKEQVKALLTTNSKIVETQDGLAFQWSEEALKDLEGFIVDAKAAEKIIQEGIEKVFDPRMAKTLDGVVADVIAEVMTSAL